MPPAALPRIAALSCPVDISAKKRNFTRKPRQPLRALFSQKYRYRFVLQAMAVGAVAGLVSAAYRFALSCGKARRRFFFA